MGENKPIEQPVEQKQSEQPNDNEKKEYTSIPLTTTINILYLLSHTLRLSAILLIISLSTKRSDNVGDIVIFKGNPQYNSHNNGNIQTLTVLYLLLRLPIVIFFELTSSQNNEYV